ncbi:hypothetical protein Q1Z72_12245 [Pseudomonas qingdaonensis]|uniref:hypothetical protein n=1 Tax=Pseudomonas qingdaonensis TaxID=2056231 RepID=UPI00265DF510|nr:hypothetical protein [Pseudomonas qingdaonensis]WKL65511.1 hypothetical protein Q1Z72_19685 [Pseudomonas qingdaonensis]WKL69376.1 hypothetical protein Q1Z72_12245 [Pseudomonas qingdaonensis]
MPTENRSSNTEQMISVPRDEVERLVKLLKYQAHPYPSPHAEFWQGLLDAPAAQHKGDPDRALKDALFACLAAGGDDREYGGVATAGDRQGWVRFTTVASGAQHQGEPLAFYREFVDGREYCEKPFTNDWTPLYTHAGAGEVDQLSRVIRDLNDERDEIGAECSRLRAQLAERDARLGIYESFPGYLIDRCEGDTIYEESLQHWLADHIKSISASAEPKCQDGGMCADSSHKCTGCARDERDERAEFESAHVAKRFNFNRKTVLGMLGEYGNPYVQSAWEGWQARAALERKS